ncbi:MAG: hypothetical protein RL215_2617 [Planctomycetota bacterium]|jgi:hypothetical protein
MLAHSAGVSFAVDKNNEITGGEAAKREVAGESPFTFGNRVDAAILRNLLIEWLIRGWELRPEFLGAVDHGACAKCDECLAANGDPPRFEVVAAPMGAEDAAAAEFAEWHLSEGGDGEAAANGFAGRAEAGFEQDAEEGCECRAVGVGLAEDELVEVLLASFTGPGSECGPSPVAEPVFG